MRLFILLFGILCYALFFVTFVCLIAFIANLNYHVPMLSFIPWRIDSFADVFSFKGLLINISLIALFGIQHSTMARQAFKTQLTKVIPEAMERSVYVLFSSLVLIALMHFWQPMTTALWLIESTTGKSIMWALFLLGWSMVFFSSFIINHFDLFGLRQVYLRFRNKPYEQLPFKIKSLYKLVRHPLYLGVLIGTWATPLMTIGHLTLAIGFTIYILVGIHYEETDMIRAFGDKYREYAKKTAMLIPFIK